MRTITALYDSKADAQNAIDGLVAAGVARESATVIDQSRVGATSSTATASTTSGRDEGGFFSALRDLFLPEEDRYSYAEGIRRGGALLSVQVEDSKIDQVVDVLDSTGAVDLDTRESEWRAQGWTGGSAAGLGASGTARAGYEDRATGVGPGARSDEEKLQVVEEQLHVGKREVGRGGLRVRSYVVETPVQEQVSLREERVNVERRPVDRPLDAARDPELFRERTIELAETVEEAVVGKTARVKEEIVLSKDVEQRTQTVSDTVRRTEVDVERVEGGVARAPTGGATRTDVDVTVERDRKKR